MIADAIAETIARVIGGHRLPPEAVFPGADGRFGVRWVRARDGMTLRAVECVPEDTSRGMSPDMPTVLCLHGWGCSAYSYRHVLPAMARAGWRAVAIDLPGHGESDKPRDAKWYRIDAMLEVIRRASAALGIGRAVVVGHSMSGPIAAMLARGLAGGLAHGLAHGLEAGESSAVPVPVTSLRVSGLVLLAPVGFGPPGHLDLARRLTPMWLRSVLPRITPRWAAWVALHSAFGEGARATARDLEEYWAPSRSPDFVRALQTLLHVFEWRAGDRGALSGVDVPTIVLRGSRDPLISPRGVDGYRQLIPGCEVREVVGCGHAVPDEAPERVVEAILAVRRY